MEIFIAPLQETDAKALWQFEVENRAYFEQTVPARGAHYYHLDSFKAILKQLLDEQAAGSSLFYLIKNYDHSIVGRINVVDIDHKVRTGQLGYRIGEAFAGQGIAKKALQLLLQQVDSKKVTQLQAVTTNNNIASQKILEHHGFTKIREDSETFELQHERVYFVSYSLER